MAKPSAVSELLLEVLRLSGRVTAAGDSLFADIGLSTARWQVVETIAEARGATASDLARTLGVSRQAVQRIVNDLRDAGLVVASSNPRHRRAPLIQLTEQGAQARELAAQRQKAWAEALGGDLPGAKLARMTERLRRIRRRLDVAEAPSPARPARSAR
jgi:DNA-binding MarR family transcriptional regulator